MFGVRPAGRKGQMVEEDEFVLGKHNYLDIPTLFSEFRASDGQQLIHGDPDIILARATPSPSEFVHHCASANWFCQTDLVGELAPNVTESLAGLTQAPGFGALTELGRSARLFVRLIQCIDEMMNQEKMSTWGGIPATRAQMLFAIQLGIKLRFLRWNLP